MESIKEPRAPAKKTWTQFAQFYIEQDFRDAMRAYLRAFKRCKSEHAARVRSTKLLARPEVQDIVSKELERVLAENRRPIEKRVFDVWTVRAFYDPTDILNLDGTLKITEEELREKGLHVCIDSIVRKVTQFATTVEYKLADRDEALGMLQQYVQMIKPQTQRHVVSGSIVTYIPDNGRGEGRRD
jgi:phage terminase small subunit